MKRVLLSLFLFLLSSIPVQVAPLSIWGRAQTSVFKIAFPVEAPDGSVGVEGGTAFCVPGASSLLMTAKHVIDEAPLEVPVLGYNGEVHLGRVLGRDAKRDVATVLLEDSPCQLASVEWAKEIPSPGPGEGGTSTLFAVGYGGLKKGMLVTEGIISGEKGIVEEMPVGVPAQLNVLGGHSGAPVFDREGRVAGMVVGLFKAYDIMDVIVPVDELRKSLKGAK